ncbi:hypothetical protein LCGC14_1469710, partial [marine sediment metagenome]
MPISISIAAILGAVLLFAAGIGVGVKLVMFGYKEGFRASYQIRGEPQDDDKSLLGIREDGQDIELAEEVN